MPHNPISIDATPGLGVAWVISSKKLIKVNQGVKMKKIFAKTKFVQLLIIVLILLILDGLLSYNSFLYNHSISANQIVSSISAEEPIGEIVEGITIVQEIPVQKDISNISVLFATYGRINKGDLFIEIVGKESGLIYGKQKYDVSTFSDNSFVTIPFDVMASSQDDSTLYRVNPKFCVNSI